MGASSSQQSRAPVITYGPVILGFPPNGNSYLVYKDGELYGKLKYTPATGEWGFFTYDPEADAYDEDAPLHLAVGETIVRRMIEDWVAQNQ